MSTLGENIRRRRKAANLTLEQVAERAGMHFVTLSDLERGKNDNPTQKTLAKISAALGCSLAELFVDEDGGSVTL